jgi:cell division septation protein DedD
MNRVFVGIPMALTLLVSRVGAQAAPAQTEAVFLRANQMVIAGQDSAGRAVVDSVLAATAEGTPRYAEALFWRASLSKTAAAAERDYRRIAVEYPVSNRAPEALFRLAQLEMTRGDRSGARAHLERLQREHPTGATSTRASVLLARLAFDDGDVPAGCAAVNAARDGLTPADIELRNQVEYYAPRCANLAAATAAATAARDSAALAAPATALGAAGRMVDSAASRSASRAAAAAAPSSGRQEYSVQVAAYETRADAEALSKRLSARGYTVRVVGDRKPFRVRVGRYPTRERAADAVRQMGRLNVHGVIVEAEPR